MDDPTKKRTADQDSQLERSNAVPVVVAPEDGSIAATRNFEEDDLKRRRVEDGVDTSFASTSDKEECQHSSPLVTAGQYTTVVNAATISAKGTNDQNPAGMEESESSQSSAPSQQDPQAAASSSPQQQQQMILMYDASGQLIAVPNPFAVIGNPISSGFHYPNLFSAASLNQSQVAQQAAAFAAAQQQFWAQAASLNQVSSGQTSETSASQSSSSSATNTTHPNISSPLVTNNILQFPASFIINNQLPQISTAMQSQHATFTVQANQLPFPPQPQPTGEDQYKSTQPTSSSTTPNGQRGRTQQHPCGVSGRSPAILYLSCDDDSLSDYQCLVRKQIELFEAKDDDVESNAQGRNKPIVLGQIGIRCRHCAALPPRHRARGATYYPAKLDGLYQAAQNMASSHLCTHCQLIPPAIRQELLVLRDRKSSAGGGKKYWADGVRALGVYEDANVLRFETR